VATETRPPFRVSRLDESTLWAAAVLLWAVADIVISVHGILTGVPELHPLYPIVMGLFDPLSQLGAVWHLSVALIAWKGVAVVLLYGLYRIVPRPHRVGVPIGLALWGGGILLWNLVVIGVQ